MVGRFSHIQVELSEKQNPILEEKYFLPVNLLRIVQDYTHKKENIELTPKMIDDGIEDADDTSTAVQGSNKVSDYSSLELFESAE